MEIGFILLGFAIGAIVARWIFRVNDIADSLKKQTDLLEQIRIQLYHARRAAELQVQESLERSGQ